ncbi:23S rRNA (uracil(1939)-C(5))-methyltransferase RlmD [Planctobacterium marinum]|uniref:23S rRNA (Uracil(1939)-C(5))-methyltransferase RlmD n=1 Tax=Planctobacterium marinum TaxID=1631968 RepID=A0AA48HPD3_9ALTE|nr:23S rRNA (uracil(1939)-C(5))-methyltransferase RlmD [Planctobacterium marinum]
MVQVFRPKKGPSRKRPVNGKGALRNTGKQHRVTIDHLDHEAKGVVPGAPVMFVSGALPGESCRVEESSHQKNVIKANVLEIELASPHRILPFCPHFDACGGCQTQYAEPEYLLSEKQNAVAKLLAKLTGLSTSDLPWSTPLIGNSRGYRRKVRLAVDARNPEGIKLGFRGEGNNIISVSECRVLEPELQNLLQPLHQMLSRLKSVKHLGHVILFSGVLESAQDTSGAGYKPQSYVTLRMTRAPGSSDKQLLERFQIAQDCLLIIDYGQKRYEWLSGEPALMAYALQSGLAGVAEHDIVLGITPDDFVQVNPQLNQAMVQQALGWLALTAQDQVLDLFCGVGNFTLPMAQQCHRVIGFEGVPEMVQMAQNNAQRNNIHNVEFVSGDLSAADTLKTVSQLKCNKVVLDPARAGAFEAIDTLISKTPEAILYISCNPATFGRDIAKLLSANYQLTKLSLIDMFPQTAHTEIMGLFVPARK